MHRPHNADGKPEQFFTEDNQIVSDGLFHERNSTETWTQYTLMTWDIQDPVNPTVTFPSIHRLYVEAEDVSEYQFAITHFYNFAHWEFIKSLEWFAPYYTAMRGELEAKLESVSTQAMLNQIHSGTAPQKMLTYFAEREYRVPDKAAPLPTNTATDLAATPIDKDWVLKEAQDTYRAAIKKGNHAAANVALKTIGQHTDVDAFAADKIEIVDPVQVYIDGELSKV
jgi:hypothetical protein